jgi:hypothetical protein
MKRALIAAIVALAGLSEVSAQATTQWDAFLAWLPNKGMAQAKSNLSQPRNP